MTSSIEKFWETNRVCPSEKVVMNKKMVQDPSKFYRERLSLLDLILWGIASYAIIVVGIVPFIDMILFGEGDTVRVAIILSATILLLGMICLVSWLWAVAMQWIDCVTLHWQKGIILYRGWEIGRIDQINKLHLRTIHERTGQRYLSSVVLHDGNHIWLEESDDLQTITATVHHIADLANVHVKQIA